MMLKIMAAGVAIGIALGGTATAQTLVPSQQAELVLIGDRDGPGRKLGHHKHKKKWKHAHKHRDWRGHSYSYRRDYRSRPYYGYAPGYGSSYGVDIYVYPRVYGYGY